MPALPTLRLNGQVFTRKSVAVRLNGVIRLTAVDSIEWSDEVPMELVSAMNEGGAPLGKAMGNYACSASMGIYLDEVPTFEAAVAALDPAAFALSGGNLAAVNFQLSVIASEDVRTHATVLVNCSIKKRGVTVGNDGAALIRQYDLQPTIVMENGLSLVRLTPAL